MQFSPATIATTVFLLAYFLLIIKAARPIYITTAASLLLVAAGAISGQQALEAINFNVLGIVGGMMILAELFVRSQAPGFFAGLLVGKVRTATAVLIVISAFSG
ncbi:MAG TPA: hypothetical protein GX738_03575, partial [Firmicutes bacterium]|nr:hypothetical protein [Bacillota bacterium]